MLDFIVLAEVTRFPDFRLCIVMKWYLDKCQSCRCAYISYGLTSIRVILLALHRIINTLIDSLPNIDGKRFRFLCNIITPHAMLRNRSTEQKIPQVDPQALQQQQQQQHQVHYFKKKI